MAKKKLRVQIIPLVEIHESIAALRPVNRQDAQYLEMVESVKSYGILNAIVVREETDTKTGKKTFCLVEGLHRFTAAKDAGLKEINATILDLSDAEVYQVQILGNLHKIETKPAAYTKQLIRILAADKLMTISDLADKLSVSTGWVSKRLSLAKLDPKIQDLVDADKIKLSNAYALASLPIDEQKNYVDRAMTESPDLFMPAIYERAKEIKDAARKGRDTSPKEFQPFPFSQKMAEIKAIFESTDTVFADALVKSEGCKTASDGVKAAIAWILHMDKISVKAQKAKDVERKAEAKAEKERRKKEREDRKAREAAVAEVAVKDE